MVSRRFAGTVLFVAFLMLSSLAVAEEGDELAGREVGLAATNFALSLSGSSCIGFESEPTGGIPSGSSSQGGTWALFILARGMKGYVLTAVVNGTGNSGFTGVSLQSTTATAEGYFGAPIVLASNPVPTSFVTEPSTAKFMFTGIFFAVGMVRRRVLVP